MNVNNLELNLARYIRRVAVTIPVNGSPATLWSLIEGSLTDDEKLRVAALVLTGFTVDFEVADDEAFSGAVEGVLASIGVYTEPCLDEWLKTTWARSTTGSTIAAVGKIYIAAAETDEKHPR